MNHLRNVWLKKLKRRSIDAKKRIGHTLVCYKKRMFCLMLLKNAHLCSLISIYFGTMVFHFFSALFFFTAFLICGTRCQSDTVSAPPGAVQAVPPTTHNTAPASEAKHTLQNTDTSGLSSDRDAPEKHALPDARPRSAALTHPGFEDVRALDSSIVLDVRYATRNNFTKAQIYDCPACLLRAEPAAAVVRAHRLLQKQGLRLKMFDCYRPRPYQQRLWDKVPNPDYVTPPAKGSMHSRGAAVDLTIIDAQGRELDMGTEYDFFGEKAHTDYVQLPAKVLENRRLLTQTLASVGFKGIRTEWWHFSYQAKDYPLSDYVWPCK